jgi:hypothetical protein
VTNADALGDLALSLARSDLGRSEAVRVLGSAAAGRRVAVVRARQILEGSPDDASGDPDTARAIALLDELIPLLTP